MSDINLQIKSILEGWSLTNYAGTNGQYNSSIAIDPDYPIGSDTKTSGVLVPTRYEKFSGTELTGFPTWIATNNKTTNTMVYTTTGKLHSFNSSIAMRTTDEKSTALPIQITNGDGNGFVFYNNYYYGTQYGATGDLNNTAKADLFQYGGMDQGVAITVTNNVWTGAKFGLANMTNTTYPTLNGVKIPNHPMFVHTDNSCYIGDVLAGQGVIHRLNTKKVTFEGDTKGTTVLSAFNALDLPFGYYPTCIGSYISNDIVIGAIQTTDTAINQGKAALFFWDTTNTDSFYRQITLPDPLVTAILNVNGIIYIWSGNAVSGVRISQYIGGDQISELCYIEDTLPPLQGAVDAIGSRLVWGSSTTYPASSSSVMAFGSKIDALPKGIHNIARSTSAGATPALPSLKFVQQASNIQPRLILGWGDASAKGLDKLSTTATFNSIWRSKPFNINKEFGLKKLTIPLAGAVDATTTITVKIYLDDGTSSVTLTTINNTNYPSKRKVLYKAVELASAMGENNFFIEIAWTGTTTMPILLPIDIMVDISDDEQ